LARGPQAVHEYIWLTCWTSTFVFRNIVENYDVNMQNPGIMIIHN
jgi:hypothetical protein